jgi:methyl-accepting chemotaxis protein
MKTSIRTKFTLGILFFFVIIVIISGFSAYYLNLLSKKTGSILKENHNSIVYAREMSEALMKINLEQTSRNPGSFSPDTILINKELAIFGLSLEMEKNNLTETGEGKLVSGIETAFGHYRDNLKKISGSSDAWQGVLLAQQAEFSSLYGQLMLLSQMNEAAFQRKTDDARSSAKTALLRMSILGTLCFLISLSFTFRFATYFNERFFQLYNGIQEMVASNYGQRLHFEGKDEFYEISLVFNKMAEKLSAGSQNQPPIFTGDSEKVDTFNDIQELKKLQSRIKGIEDQAQVLMSRLENRKT